MEKYEEVTFTRNQINKLIDVVDHAVLKRKIKIRELSSGVSKNALYNGLIEMEKQDQTELEEILKILNQAWRSSWGNKTSCITKKF